MTTDGTKSFNIVSILSALLNFILFFFAGFKHTADSYYYNEETGWMSDKDYRYSCYKCIFGSDRGYDFLAPKVKGSFALILGFIILIAFIILLIVTMAMDSKGNTKIALYIVLLAFSGLLLFLFSPIFTLIALTKYNSGVEGVDEFGQNYYMRLGFGFIAVFINMIFLLVFRIIALVRVKNGL